MKSLILAFVIVTAISCTKSKIENTCKNNGLEIRPSDYNKDSAVLYMVNAFTPNGDGLNDMFRPIIWGIDMSDFKVCKGNKVIYTEENMGEGWNSTQSGWDGTNDDGIKCKDGVYNYIIIGSNATDGEFEISGNVSLITEQKNKNCLCKYEDMIDPSNGFVVPSGESCDRN
ncbi:gliding motility-associated C-terminal domain-containing protein [Bacteroidia bacterium]|nr:gliding motility-associated C-terminal domain-containing protein [Bacteroidia bacterium]MDB9882635.1 gliding motility-associated C-terminal domain-containing protein [Bacteroidia bacterium]